MSIKKFITDVLNIESDKIESIDSIDAPNGDLSLRIKLVSEVTKCPHCGGSIKSHGYYDRKLTHSTFINRKCTIIYRQHRYRCKPCEFTFHEKNPFGNEKENMTYETKINILEDLKHVESTYTAVARRQNVTVTQVIRIFDRYVDIPRKTLPEVLSIDEHYFPESSYDSVYMCILMDFKDGTIIDVLPDRKKSYLSSYFGGIKNTTLDDKTHISELNNVKYVSIDLWDAYKEIAQIYFPKAIICADSFHVLEHLTKCFRAVRLKCRRKTEDQNLQYLLTRFKYIFNTDTNLDNKGKYNKRFRRVLNHRQMIEILFERFPELRAAYLLKEEYIEFNRTANEFNAKEQLTDLISKFGSCEIPEYIEFYNLLCNWFPEIVNSFYKYNGKRINNSYVESRNNNIERLVYNAYGFTNFERTRNRVLYCLNKNDTYKL